VKRLSYIEDARCLKVNTKQQQNNLARCYMQGLTDMLYSPHVYGLLKEGCQHSTGRSDGSHCCNILQRQSFYYPLPYTVALRDTKLTVPLNMKLESLRPLVCFNHRFESCRTYGCLSLHSLVCCQVAVFSTSRSLVQKSPMRCGVSQWVSSRNLLEEALFRKGCPAMIKKID
jgi:hypothetical protein